MTDDEIQDYLQNLSNYENISQLFYTPASSHLDYKQVNKIFFYCVTISTGLLCNGLIVCVIACTKSLRTKFNLYIINLAVADILVTSLCSWVHLLTDLKQNWVLGDLMCRLNTFMQVTVVSASILTLTTTVLDRYLAARQPQYLPLTQRCQCVVILAIWTSACLTALPWLLYMGVVRFHWATGVEVDCQDVFPSARAKTIYITVFAIVFYVLPLGTMFVLLFVTLRTPVQLAQTGRLAVLGPEPGLHHSHSATSVSQLSDTEHDRREQLTGNVYRQTEYTRRTVGHMTLSLLVVFFVCWTPQQVTLVWDVYRDKHEPKPAGIEAFKYTALFLAYSSSAFHPIVYICFNKCFRVAALQTLRFWRRENNSVIAVQPAPSSDSPV